MATDHAALEWFKKKMDQSSADDYDTHTMLQKLYAPQPGQIIPYNGPPRVNPSPPPAPKPETLDTDQYEITRKLAGTKELRFKQIASNGRTLVGLTDDGIAYEQSVRAGGYGEDGWRRCSMRDVS
jgi:hypothetical protein